MVWLHYAERFDWPIFLLLDVLLLFLPAIRVNHTICLEMVGLEERMTSKAQKQSTPPTLSK